MALLNHETREVVFKVVYCGPGMSGKTTNLEYVHSGIGEGQRGDLVSLSTSSDRTVFFDFLPVNAVVLNGYGTKFQLYTVPGQVIYNATRQLVLRGVDGLVFVADSRIEMLEENVRSFENMVHNLALNRSSVERTPLVLQYNKRDLPDIATLEQLDYLLNRRPQAVPSFEAVARDGGNVFTTLNTVSQMILYRFYQVMGAEPKASFGAAATAPSEPAETGRGQGETVAEEAGALTV